MIADIALRADEIDLRYNIYRITENITVQQKFNFYDKDTIENSCIEIVFNYLQTDFFNIKIYHSFAFQLNTILNCKQIYTVTYI